MSGKWRSGMRQPAIRCAIFAGAVALCCAGCAAKWNAVPEGRQVPVMDSKGLIEERDGLIVSATTVPVPYSDEDDVLGFTVEITNHRAALLNVRLEQFALRDSAGRLRRPMDEETLRRRYNIEDDSYAEASVLRGVASADVSWGGVVLARYRPRAYRPYRHRYPRYYDYWYPYRDYYWYWGPYWYPGWGYYSYYYDGPAEAEAQQRRIARFLSEVWHDSTLAPDEVGTGHVLFAQHTEKGDVVTLTFRPEAASGEPGAAQEKGATEFAFRFVRSR